MAVELAVRPMRSPRRSRPTCPRARPTCSRSCSGRSPWRRSTRRRRSRPGWTLPSRYVVAAANRATRPRRAALHGRARGGPDGGGRRVRRRGAVVPGRGRGRAARGGGGDARAQGRRAVKRTRTQRLSLLAAIMGSFVVGLDSTVVNVALPGDRGGPRRRAGGPAMGQQRLPARARRADPRRRVARRRVRRAARVLARPHRLRRVLDDLRARARHRGARGGPRAPGRVRRAAHPERAGGHRHRLPARPARRGGRLVDRRGRASRPSSGRWSAGS